jgi:NAD kinase
MIVGESKIVLVVRPTRLDDLVVRHNTIQQAQFYVEHLGADFSDYLAEHRRYHEAVRATEDFIFGPDDTVVVLGQDGLVANTLKYIDGQHVVGVNPDPARWDGALLPFTIDDLPHVMPEELRRQRAVKTVTMAKAALNNGQTLHAVNDLFIGQRSHVSARYKIAVAGREEQHSSSGIIVSTGLGSTGWLKSVYARMGSDDAHIDEAQSGGARGRHVRLGRRLSALLRARAFSQPHHAGQYCRRHDRAWRPYVHRLANA